MRHPAACHVADVRAFLESLATVSRVAASTQNQAYAAIQFLYTNVLGRSLGALPAYVRALRPKRLPTVLEPEEVSQVLAQLDDTPRLLAMLLYGAGLRLNEATALRVKDLDLRRRMLLVRDGKGAQDRRTVLPDALVPLLEERVRRVRL